MNVKVRIDLKEENFGSEDNKHNIRTVTQAKQLFIPLNLIRTHCVLYTLACCFILQQHFGFRSFCVIDSNGSLFQVIDLRDNRWEWDKVRAIYSALLPSLNHIAVILTMQRSCYCYATVAIPFVAIDTLLRVFARTHTHLFTKNPAEKGGERTVHLDFIVKDAMRVIVSQNFKCTYLKIIAAFVPY